VSIQSGDGYAESLLVRGGTVLLVGTPSVSAVDNCAPATTLVRTSHITPRQKFRRRNLRDPP
jgi:hypothetical protein